MTHRTSDIDGDSSAPDMYDDDALRCELRTTWDNAVALALGCGCFCVAFCAIGCAVWALVAWL